MCDELVMIYIHQELVMIVLVYSGMIASMPLFTVVKYVPGGYLTSCS